MEIADIRRKVLAAIVERDGLASVAKRVEKPDSQINDMLAGRKSFGEKVARAIEKKYAPDLPPGWLDKDDAPKSMSCSASEQPNPPCVDANLNKSTEFLAGNTTTVAFSKDEQELVKGYRLASPREKRSMLHTAQIVIEDFSKRSEQKK